MRTEPEQLCCVCAFQHTIQDYSFCKLIANAAMSWFSCVCVGVFACVACERAHANVAMACRLVDFCCHVTCNCQGRQGLRIASVCSIQKGIKHFRMFA
jgi:hypothetical protein